MQEVLTEVSEWKLDAKLEEADRYFYSLPELNPITRGQRCYVIGRKGMGKTAIAEQLLAKRAATTFAEKLTFKNYPFNELYRLDNSGYNRPNQYITLWKYLIYSTVCRMMVANEAIPESVRQPLRDLYGSADSMLNLRRAIPKWTASDFGVSLLGSGIEIARTKEARSQTWIERVDILEDVISEYIDRSAYFVVFDELDEDFRAVVEGGARNDYLALITSLFKAVQDIKATLPREASVHPIVFLRDDIYELILDADKNKWADFKLDLNWDLTRMKSLLAFRISRAKDRDGEILSFLDAWSLIFLDRPIRYGSGGKKKTNVLAFIARSTQLRPRDFVRYLQACAEETLRLNAERNWSRPMVSPFIVKRVDKAFSNYLRNELVDEIYGTMPEIQEILATISEIRKWNFSVREFRSALNRRQGLTVDPDVALRTLFHFSVIGNQSKPGHHFFRYLNPEARFNFKERIVVHRGLLKALQIY